MVLLKVMFPLRFSNLCFVCALFFLAGHLIAPLVAHIVCNFMGLPVVYAQRKGTHFEFLHF